MFAIALWDGGRRRLVLARDRAGKKPLFYYRDDRRLVFASEIKAIFAHPDVEDRRSTSGDPAVLHCTATCRTPTRSIAASRRSTPATPRDCRRGRRVSGRARYWRLEFPDARAQPPDDRSAEAARRQVRSLMTAAVERRLVSDVPLGAFLSGGVDSTIVVG